MLCVEEEQMCSVMDGHRLKTSGDAAFGHGRTEGGMVPVPAHTFMQEPSDVCGTLQLSSGTLQLSSHCLGDSQLNHFSSLGCLNLHL